MTRCLIKLDSTGLFFKNQEMMSIYISPRVNNITPQGFELETSLREAGVLPLRLRRSAIQLDC